MVNSWRRVDRGREATIRSSLLFVLADKSGVVVTLNFWLWDFTSHLTQNRNLIFNHFFLGSTGFVWTNIPGVHYSTFPTGLHLHIKLSPALAVTVSTYQNHTWGWCYTVRRFSNSNNSVSSCFNNYAGNIQQVLSITNWQCLKCVFFLPWAKVTSFKNQ